jgi:biotin-(acetyl-CoA carboxylase) ligase
VRIAAGDVPRRDDLCSAILRALDALVGSDDWLDDYRERCDTLGAEVRVELAEGSVEGRVTGVRDDGALLVDGRAVIAGDVVHVRES